MDKPKPCAWCGSKRILNFQDLCQWCSDRLKWEEWHKA